MTAGYHRHAGATDEIYRTMMAERTGEDPENYRDRPFDMDLLDYAPSRGRHTGQARSDGTRTLEQTIEDTARALGVSIGPVRAHYRRLSDTPQA